MKVIPVAIMWYNMVRLLRTETHCKADDVTKDAANTDVAHPFQHGLQQNVRITSLSSQPCVITAWKLHMLQ